MRLLIQSKAHISSSRYEMPTYAVLKAIVRCSGPDVVRKPKLLDMTKTLEVPPVQEEKSTIR